MGCGAEGPRGQKGTDTTPSPSAHVGVSPWKLLRSLFIQGIFLSESLGCLLWLWLCVKTCSFLNIDKQRTAPAFLPSWAALSSLEELPGLDDRLPAAALLCTSQCGSCVWQPSLRLNCGARGSGTESRWPCRRCRLWLALLPASCSAAPRLPAHSLGASAPGPRGRGAEVTQTSEAGLTRLS